MAALCVSHPRHRACSTTPKESLCRPSCGCVIAACGASRGYLRRPTGASAAYGQLRVCDKFARTCVYTNNPFARKQPSRLRQTLQTCSVSRTKRLPIPGGSNMDHSLQMESAQEKQGCALTETCFWTVGYERSVSILGNFAARQQ
jgi:hypothetical protein